MRGWFTQRIHSRVRWFKTVPSRKLGYHNSPICKDTVRVWNNRFLTDQGRNSAISRVGRVSLRRPGRVVSSRCGSCLSQTFFLLNNTSCHQKCHQKTKSWSPRTRRPGRSVLVRALILRDVLMSYAIARDRPRKDEFGRKY
jgi:hypothetical protein